MSFDKTISAIVCAFNEEKTIKPILEILLHHPKINEVIAVDDGSTDKTWRKISSINNPKLIPIRHGNNLGKGAAIAFHGAPHATGLPVLRPI